jgi:hypothetical protein
MASLKKAILGRGWKILPFMMLYPYVRRPREMVAESTASCHTGTGALEEAASPVFHAE